MKFRLHEYVTKYQGVLGKEVHGKITGLLPPDRYVFQVGGMDITSAHEVAEGILTQIMPDRIVAPPSYPPIAYLSGTMTIPQLAYPFSNEKGFEQEDLWTALNHGGMDAGAVVGVSGSVLDIATKIASCGQIVSVDINTETVKVVEKLRSLLAESTNVTSMVLRKTHWKSQIQTDTQINLSKLLSECALYWRGHLDEYVKELNLICTPAEAGLRFKKLLIDIENKSKSKINYSQWFKDENACQKLASMAAAGRISILCVDLQHQDAQRGLQRTLDCDVAVFNISNALDYIKNADAIIQLLQKIGHTTNAKVISSSQVDGQMEDLGSFAKPKVTRWDAFIEILRDKGVRARLGTLQDF